MMYNRPVYRFPRRALTLCLQLSMGIQPGACFPARSADALPATLYRQFAQAIYRKRPTRPCQEERERVLNANIAILEVNDGAGFAYFNKLVDSVERAVVRRCRLTLSYPR
jgi:hypothetical protein